MCSVVGYIGKNLSKDFILEGLTRLEYRGYDSSGFSCISPSDNRLLYLKAEGRLQNLTDKFQGQPLNGFVAVGHTRWSTHGASTENNAHPHFDCKKTLSIVHNGIIENHHELREQLEREGGHVFHSETDTEVVAHYFEQCLALHQDLKAALVDLLSKLEGAYAFVIILQDYPDTVITVRKRSPLCLGVGEEEMFVASDPLAFAGKTKKVVFMPDVSFALLHKDSYEIYDFKGEPLSVAAEELDLNWTDNEAGGFEHFMLKEIYEQKNVINNTVHFYQNLTASIPKQMGLRSSQLKNLESLNLIGCGTSWHAARIAQFFFEKVTSLPTRVFLASEFRYMPFFSEKKTLYLTISQSGETADTLEALRMINSLEIPTVALTNVPSSSMVREANGFLLTQAGPEVAVASTKAFSTQVTALYWLAHRIALEKGIINQRLMQLAEADLLVAAEVLENSIENYKREILNGLAAHYAQYKKSIFLGRNISYPFAMEAALKLKEISYIFAQCYPAGELKHGPIALIDDQTPIFMFSVLDPLIYQKLVANAQEVKARGGHLIVFAFEGQRELIKLADQVFIIPKVNPLLGPLAMTGLMQFFVYAIAKELGRSIDKPRNLAKSVTVE
jgi:glucosamine--fructose-6-phosphate aminotransferase (isomerizing)